MKEKVRARERQTDGLTWRERRTVTEKVRARERQTDRQTDMERGRSELAVLWRKLTIYTQNSKSRRVEMNHSNGALASQ